MESESRGACYFLCGNWAKYLGPMCVSLFTLRQHYHGPVCVLVGEDCVIPSNILIDLHKSGATPRTGIPLADVRRHRHYVTKATLWRHSPFDHTALLDADTVVTGSIDELFGNDIVATRFSNWITTGRKISGRIKQWERVIGDGLVKYYVTNSLPAINTGVVSWIRGRSFLRRWEERSIAGHWCSFTDEYALQTFLHELLEQPWFTLLDDRFNCSPTYGINRDDARIWHYHGRRMVRKDDCRKMYAPHLRDAFEHNFCNMQDWLENYDHALSTIGQDCSAGAV